MRSAGFERLETLFAAITFAEAGRFEAADDIVHGTLSAADVRSQA